MQPCGQYHCGRARAGAPGPARRGHGRRGGGLCPHKGNGKAVTKGRPCRAPFLLISFSGLCAARGAPRHAPQVHTAPGRSAGSTISARRAAASIRKKYKNRPNTQRRRKNRTSHSFLAQAGQRIRKVQAVQHHQICVAPHPEPAARAGEHSIEGVGPQRPLPGTAAPHGCRRTTRWPFSGRKSAHIPAGNSFDKAPQRRPHGPGARGHGGKAAGIVYTVLAIGAAAMHRCIHVSTGRPSAS